MQSTGQAEPLLQGPKWNGNSCAADTLLYHAKVLDIFDPRQTVEWKKGATLAQRAVADAVNDRWSEMVAKNTRAKNELITQVLEEMSKADYESKKLGEYLSIDELWNFLTEGLPTTTVRVQTIRICKSCGDSHHKTPKPSTSLHLTHGLEELLKSPDDRSTSAFLHALFGPEIEQESHCKKCINGEIQRMLRVVEGGLPAVLFMPHIPRTLLKYTDYTARFRYFGPPPRRDMYYAEYRTRAISILESEHFTGIVIDWKGKTKVGGYVYNGMDPTPVQRLSNAALDERLKSLRASADHPGWDKGGKENYSVKLWMEKVDG